MKLHNQFCKLLLTTALLGSACLSTQASAFVELITGAKITNIASTANGSDDFWIRLSGGTGICASSGMIVFPRERFASDASQSRAFSLALLAYTQGKTIRIANFVDSSCTGAGHIELMEDQ